eukprot:363049-Chlamydomonas_euryale.AAC.22
MPHNTSICIPDRRMPRTCASKDISHAAAPKAHRLGGHRLHQDAIMLNFQLQAREQRSVSNVNPVICGTTDMRRRTLSDAINALDAVARQPASRPRDAWRFLVIPTPGGRMTVPGLRACTTQFGCVPGDGAEADGAGLGRATIAYGCKAFLSMLSEEGCDGARPQGART